MKRTGVFIWIRSTWSDLFRPVMKTVRSYLLPWLSLLLCVGISQSHGDPGQMPIPLASLPDVQPAQGKLSLVEESSNKAAARLYLANTGSDQVPGAAFGFSQAFKEALVDGRWQRCQSFPPEAVVNICADGILDNLPPPLSPGHAWEIKASDGDDGDIEGEIRFCQPLLNAAPLVTKPRKGRYSKSELDNAAKDACSYWGLHKELYECLQKDGLSKGKVFTSIGELAAALELERAYDKCGLPRQFIARWLEKNPKGFAKTTPDEMAALREVLARPWTRTRDDRNRLEACLEALSQAGRKKHPAGAPARYPSMVWRYLSTQSHLRMADEYCQNPERWDAIGMLKASGNDWGATPEELAKLGVLSKKSVESGIQREVEAARPFLRFKVADVE